MAAGTFGGILLFSGSGITAEPQSWNPSLPDNSTSGISGESQNSLPYLNNDLR